VAVTRPCEARGGHVFDRKQRQLVIGVSWGMGRGGCRGRPQCVDEH
jgi:hypothetical protein